MRKSASRLTRIRQVRELLGKSRADAVLVSRLSDLRWLTGFTGSSGIAVVLHDGAHFYTDGRYDVQARGEVEAFEIHVTSGRGVKAISTNDVLSSARRVIVQSDDLTIAQLRSAERGWPDRLWIEETDLLSGLRAQKLDEELAAITAAQRITESVFSASLSAIRPGTTEREVAALISSRGRDVGVEGLAFEPIVAGGPNAALPHARPSERRFEYGDLIILDFGYRIDGYCSDMTRTVALGEPGPEARRAYDTVLRARNAAIDTVRVGAAARDVDAAARTVIAKGGLGQAFTHSTGHGVGLDVHEWPRLSEQSSDVLPPDCVVTVEPGVYLEDRFGVRIEDMVVARESGCQNLTEAESELIVL